MDVPSALMNPFLFFLRSQLKFGSLRQLSLSKSDRGFVLPLVIMIGLVLIVASLGIFASFFSRIHTIKRRRLNRMLNRSINRKFLLFLCRSRSPGSDSGLSMLEVLVAMMVVFLTFMTSVNGLLFAAMFQVKAERQAQATYWIQQDLEQVKSLAAAQASDPTKDKCKPVFTTSYAGDLQSTLASNTAITGTSPAAVSVTTTPVGRRQSQVVKTSETSTVFTTNTTKKLMGKEYRLVRITEGYNNNPQILKITYRVGLPTDSTSDTDRIQDDATGNTSILANLYTEVIPPQALSCS